MPAPALIVDESSAPPSRPLESRSANEQNWNRTPIDYALGDASEEQMAHAACASCAITTNWASAALRVHYFAQGFPVSHLGARPPPSTLVLLPGAM